MLAYILKEVWGFTLSVNLSTNHLKEKYTSNKYIKQAPSLTFSLQQKQSEVYLREKGIILPLSFKQAWKKTHDLRSWESTDRED